jgi:hypothetical protein
VEAARGRTVHEVERLVSGQKRGARPTDEAEGVASVSALTCERCGRGSQDARGEVVPVDDAIVGDGAV